MEATTSPFAMALTGGIGYEMFFYAFVGSMIHFLQKWINGINDVKKRGEEFHFINWFTDAFPTLLFSILCGIVSVFGISQYWTPVTITKSIIAGLVAGSAIFNILPAITNPDMWASVGEWIVNKFKPKNKD